MDDYRIAWLDALCVAGLCRKDTLTRTYMGRKTVVERTTYTVPFGGVVVAILNEKPLDGGVEKEG